MSSPDMQLTPEQQASIQYQMAHINDTHQPQSIGVTVLFFTLATVAFVMRLWSRKVARAPYKWDDWTALAGWVMLLGLNINFLINVVNFGYGRHVVAIGPENVTNVLKGTFAFQWFYIITLTLIRSSIVLFYLRIFGTSRYRWIFIAVEVYILAFCVAMWGVILGQCTPIRKQWYPMTPGKCLPYKGLSESASALNVLGDMLVLIAPIPIIWRLQASTRRKWAVTSVFVLGGMVCIVSFIRLFYTRKVLQSLDFTWDGWEGGILSVIEPNVGLVCACLPTILPLFRKRPRGDSGQKSEKSSGWLGSKLSKLRSPKNSNRSATSDNSFQLLPGSSDRAVATPDPWSAQTGVAAPAQSRPKPAWTAPEPHVAREMLGNDKV
ncbi:MAG: swr complex subunit [Watsoniomyces obsoletus]|nr:MAG: swr complex subunit [Watsoniomyces obsoletus]